MKVNYTILDNTLLLQLKVHNPDLLWHTKLAGHEVTEDLHVFCYDNNHNSVCQSQLLMASSFILIDDIVPSCATYS